MNICEAQQGLERRLRPIQRQLDNYVEAIGKGFDVNKATLARMQALEEQKEQLTSRLEELSLVMKNQEREHLNAQTMAKTLKDFSQLIEISTPEEKKTLLPTIVERITFSEDQIEIALYDRPIVRGLVSETERRVNQDGDYALSGIDWLPEQDSNLRPSG